MRPRRVALEFPARPRSGRRVPRACRRPASCPVRAQRDTMLKLASGRCRLNQRSRRMPSSSASTVKRRMVWLPCSCEHRLSELSPALQTTRAAPAALMPAHSRLPSANSPRSTICAISRLKALKVVKPPSICQPRRTGVYFRLPRRCAHISGEKAHQKPAQQHWQ
jgi:hypothetical protein